MFNSNRSWAASVSGVLVGFMLHSQIVMSSPSDDPSTIRLSFADLDLSRPADAQTLYLRIKRAARIVCDATRSDWDVARLRHWKECFAKAIDDAVSRIDRPTLTALHRGETRATPAG
jgi:UrcA family protein